MPVSLSNERSEEGGTTIKNIRKMKHHRNTFSKHYNSLANPGEKAGEKRELSYTGLSKMADALSLASVISERLSRLLWVMWGEENDGERKALCLFFFFHTLPLPPTPTPQTVETFLFVGNFWFRVTRKN